MNKRYLIVHQQERHSDFQLNNQSASTINKNDSSFKSDKTIELPDNFMLNIHQKFDHDSHSKKAYYEEIKKYGQSYGN